MSDNTPERDWVNELEAARHEFPNDPFSEDEMDVVANAVHNHPFGCSCELCQWEHENRRPIAITYGPIKDRSADVRVNGEYFALLTYRPLGMPQGVVMVCFSPDAMQRESDMDRRTVGVYINDTELDLTIEQFWRMNKGVTPPF